MALNQLIPKFRLEARSAVELKPVPRGRAPVEVQFRAGGDLSGVVEFVAANRCVRLDAATGAGKSTVFPRALAGHTKALVLLVLPYDNMAASAYRFLSSGSSDKGDVHLRLRVAGDFPASGLVVTTAACLVARWLEAGSVALPKCYLLHDEYHESGFASALLRAFGPSLSGVLSYVLMSATGKIGDFRSPETPSQVTEMKYDRDSFADPWSVEQPGAPWSVHVLDGNVLVFEDDPRRAASLVSAYAFNGFRSYRLTSRTTQKDFLATVAALEDPTEATLCAIVADSTYRSGYTLPVDVVVDSGVVRRTVVDSGGDVKFVRRVLHCGEVAQTRGRLGRLPGRNGTYWYPLGEVDNKVCDLEQTDAEAVALVCRLLGYRPIPEVANAVMASGPIPEDVCEALRGDVPLAALAGGALREIPQVPAARVGRAQVDGSDDEDGLRPRATASTRTAIMSMAKQADEALLSFVSAETDSQLELGSYYCAEGVTDTSVRSRVFPDGVASVRRVLAGDASGVVYMSWPPDTRSVAVNALLHDYNLATMQWKARARALATVAPAAGGLSKAALRVWAGRCMEEMAVLESRAQSALDLSAVVAESFCGITDCTSVLIDREDALAAVYERELKGLPGLEPAVRDAEVERVHDWSDSVSTLIGSTVGGKTLTGGSKRSENRVRELKIPAPIKWFTGFPSSAVHRRLSGGSSTKSSAPRIRGGSVGGSPWRSSAADWRGGYPDSADVLGNLLLGGDSHTLSRAASGRKSY